LGHPGGDVVVGARRNDGTGGVENVKINLGRGPRRTRWLLGLPGLIELEVDAGVGLVDRDRQEQRRAAGIEVHEGAGAHASDRAYAPLFQGLRTTFSCVFEGLSWELSSHYIINTNCNTLYSPIHYRKVANM